jgi:hypothetical protein
MLRESERERFCLRVVREREVERERERKRKRFIKGYVYYNEREKL